MRNFGATASNFDQLRSDLESTTCRVTQGSDKFDSYYELLPLATKNPPELGKTGRYWYWNVLKTDWEKYYPYWDARGWANTSWYIDNGETAGRMYVTDRGAIDDHYRKIFQNNGMNPNYFYNICSYYVWWLFRTGEVHPDIAPFYQGNLNNNVTIKKISEAEKRWAENERKNLIRSVLLHDFESVLTEYRQQGVNANDSESMQNFIDKQLGDLDVNNNENWSQSLEDIGMGSSEDKKSILPMVAVASFLTVGTFALLKWRKA